MSYQQGLIYDGRTKTGTIPLTMSISHSDVGNATSMGIYSEIVQTTNQALNKKARIKRIRMGSPRSREGKELPNNIKDQR